MMKKRKALNSSLLLMFFGFLCSVIGIMQTQVSADTATAAGSAFPWALLLVIGLVLIIFGLLGFILAELFTDR